MTKFSERKLRIGKCCRYRAASMLSSTHVSVSLLMPRFTIQPAPAPLLLRQVFGKLPFVGPSSAGRGCSAGCSSRVQKDVEILANDKARGTNGETSSGHWILDGWSIIGRKWGPVSCLVVCTMNTRYPNCLTSWMIGDRVWESNSRSKLFSERDDPEIDCGVLFF